MPFDAGRYGSPTIVDRSPAETTVSLDPHGSQYSLVVITFDREKQVPVKVMSYKDTYSNLLRMRREQRPRPGRRPLAADGDLDRELPAQGDQHADVEVDRRRRSAPALRSEDVRHRAGADPTVIAYRSRGSRHPSASVAHPFAHDSQHAIPPSASFTPSV